MYCPLCGKKLVKVERDEESRKINDWEYDESDWYSCPENDCFGEDFPLVHHHAPRNNRGQDGYSPDIMNTRPGESWSLTWLK